MSPGFFIPRVSPFRLSQAGSSAAQRLTLRGFFLCEASMQMTVEAERTWLLVLKQLVENCVAITAAREAKHKPRALH